MELHGIQDQFGNRYLDTTSKGIRVVTVNAAGTIVTLAHAEDVAHASGDLGYMLLAIRSDTAAALAGTSGDYIPLIVDASGRLHVINSALEKAEDAAHTSGDSGVMALGVRTDTPAALAGTTGDYIPMMMDASGYLYVKAREPSGISDGSKAVTTAGSEVTLVASSTACRSVTIQAKRANTGYIYVGGATVASTSGVELSPGDSISLNIDDLVKVYIDSSVNGEGVQFTYLT